MTPPVTTQDMLPSEETFLAAMQRLGFGRFEYLQIRGGELVRSFPLETSAQFEADPIVLGSVDRKVRDAKAADASVKDLDSFKAAFGNIGKNDCGGCHEKYRLKKS